jgi:hypothetical protein
MAKHSQRPDMPIISAFVGAHQARDELAEQHGAAERATTEDAEIQQATPRWQQAIDDVWDRHRRDLETVEASADVAPRLLDQGGPDTCQQPGCHGAACWYVRFRHGTTHRPAYRPLCTRDAARRIRRRAHQATRTASRRDHTR